MKTSQVLTSHELTTHAHKNAVSALPLQTHQSTRSQNQKQAQRQQAHKNADNTDNKLML